MRDILHYTDDEINRLSLVDYNLALNYALDTYARRDIVFVMGSIYGKKPKNYKNTLEISIQHPEIEEYIKKSHEE